MNFSFSDLGQGAGFAKFVTGVDAAEDFKKFVDKVSGNDNNSSSSNNVSNRPAASSPAPTTTPSTTSANSSTGVATATTVNLNGDIISVAVATPKTQVICFVGDEMVPPAVDANPYLSPSTAAKLAIVLMEVMALKREIASKEDEAIQNVMGWMVQNLGFEKAAIAAKADADIHASKGAIINASMGLVSAVISLATICVAEYQKDKQIKALDKEDNRAQITEVRTEEKAKESAQEIKDNKEAKDEKADLKEVKIRLTDEKIAKEEFKIEGQAAKKADIATNAVKLDDKEKAQVEEGAEYYYKAASGEKSVPAADKMSAEQAKHMEAAKASSYADMKMEKKYGDLPNEKMTEAQKAEWGQLRDDYKAGKVETATEQEKAKPAAKELSYEQKVKQIESKWDNLVAAVGQFSKINENTGRIIEEGYKIESYVAGSKADQLKATVHTSRELTQMFSQQLMNDRNKIDEDFNSILQFLKQSMSKETDMQAQLFRPL